MKIAVVLVALFGALWISDSIALFPGPAITGYQTLEDSAGTSTPIRITDKDSAGTSTPITLKDTSQALTDTAQTIQKISRAPKPGILLYAGDNYVAVTPDMIGKTGSQIAKSSTCDRGFDNIGTLEGSSYMDTAIPQSMLGRAIRFDVKLKKRYWIWEKANFYSYNCLLSVSSEPYQQPPLFITSGATIGITPALTGRPLNEIFADYGCDLESITLYLRTGKERSPISLASAKNTELTQNNTDSVIRVELKDQCTLYRTASQPEQTPVSTPTPTVTAQQKPQEEASPKAAIPVRCSEGEKAVIRQGQTNNYVFEDRTYRITADEVGSMTAKFTVTLLPKDESETTVTAEVLAHELGEFTMMQIRGDTLLLKTFTLLADSANPGVPKVPYEMQFCIQKADTSTAQATQSASTQQSTQETCSCDDWQTIGGCGEGCLSGKVLQFRSCSGGASCGIENRCVESSGCKAADQVVSQAAEATKGTGTSQPKCEQKEPCASPKGWKCASNSICYSSTNCQFSCPSTTVPEEEKKEEKQPAEACTCGGWETSGGCGEQGCPSGKVPQFRSCSGGGSCVTENRCVESSGCKAAGQAAEATKGTGTSQPKCEQKEPCASPKGWKCASNSICYSSTNCQFSCPSPSATGEQSTQETCSCGDWLTSGGCGEGGCPSNKVPQSKSCTGGASCKTENKCVESAQCTKSQETEQSQTDQPAAKGVNLVPELVVTPSTGVKGGDTIEVVLKVENTGAKSTSDPSVKGVCPESTGINLNCGLNFGASVSFRKGDKNGPEAMQRVSSAVTYSEILVGDTFSSVKAANKHVKKAINPGGSLEVLRESVKVPEDFSPEDSSSKLVIAAVVDAEQFYPEAREDDNEDYEEVLVLGSKLANLVPIEAEAVPPLERFPVTVSSIKVAVKNIGGRMAVAEKFVGGGYVSDPFLVIKVSVLKGDSEVCAGEGGIMIEAGVKPNEIIRGGIPMNGQCRLEDANSKYWARVDVDTLQVGTVRGIVAESNEIDNKDSFPIKGSQTCSPLGSREAAAEKYCSITGTLVTQKAAGSLCDHNFECVTDLCICMTQPQPTQPCPEKRCVSAEKKKRIIEEIIWK